MSPILLRNVGLPAALIANPDRLGGHQIGDLRAGDLLLRNGKVEAFLGTEPPPLDSRELHLGGRILLPRLVEPHCHLDKCHTIGRLEGVGGDLQRAMTIQRADKSHWTREDVRSRAGRGIAELVASGCGWVRSHVDWDNAREPFTDEPPLAWTVLGELADEWRDGLRLQRCALVSLEDFDDKRATSGLAKRSSEDNAALGVYVFDQGRKKKRLRKVFDLAERYGLPLDFHVDEGLSKDLNGLLAIADIAIERKFQGPVLCGHACSLMNLSGSALKKALEKIARAGISVVALPATNLYLQGRCDGSPDRRGITRIRELQAAGVPVTFGSDNVGDAFCPLGRHDPMASLASAALAAQLDPPYGPWLATITRHGRNALGYGDLPLEDAEIDDLLVVEARHSADVVAGAPRSPLVGQLRDAMPIF